MAAGWSVIFHAHHRLMVAFLVLSGCASEPLRRPVSAFGAADQERAAPRSPVRSAAYQSSRGLDASHLAGVSATLPPPTKDNEPSFCKLNPGACPEPPANPEPDDYEDAAGNPWKYFACIQACKGGQAAGEEFCEALPTRTPKQRTIKALCFGAVHAGATACEVFCRAYFGPPRSP